MSFTNHVRKYEVVFTGLCYLEVDSGSGNDPKMHIVKSPRLHIHTPLLTYRLDAYSGPELAETRTVPGADGSLLVQVPLVGDVEVGTASATAPTTVNDLPKLGQASSISLAFRHLCETAQMTLELSKIKTDHTVTFKGGHLTFRKPVADPQGEIPLWKHPAGERVFAEQIVWREQSSELLEIKFHNSLPTTSYLFGRTAHTSVALTNLPERATPGKATGNYVHWHHLATDVGSTYRAPEQTGGGVSHSSSSCPPTGATR